MDENKKLVLPLIIDFAGGWTDISFIMDGKTSYVSNVAITPLVEYGKGNFNFSRGLRKSKLSTSTEPMNYIFDNTNTKSLDEISEELFKFENKGLNWTIGRQNQYAIVHGGFNCWKCTLDSAVSKIKVSQEILQSWKNHLLLLDTGISQNVPKIIEQIYANYKTNEGKEALYILGQLGLEFAINLKKKKFNFCGKIMDKNWKAQKQLASASSNEQVDKMYDFAKSLGAKGKLCGAGGGGAFIFYHQNPTKLKEEMQKYFSSCSSIDFNFEYNDVKTLNNF